MNKTLSASLSLGEVAAGLLLLAVPALAARALFGAPVAGAGVLMTRFAGIALLGLGVACWPGETTRQAAYGWLTYGLLTMVYLIIVGVGSDVGILLWPAVVLHFAMSLLLVWTLSKPKRLSAKQVN